MINGIVAKYYDFTTDSIALSVSDKESADLAPLLVKTYGGYYDEAKQRFFDLYNSKKDLRMVSETIRPYLFAPSCPKRSYFSFVSSR